MELGVSHVQNLSSLTPIVDNIFDKYNKNLVPIRSLSDHDTIYISPMNHGSNRSEIYIRTLNDIITKCLVGTGSNWPLYVPSATFAMNCQV